MEKDRTGLPNLDYELVAEARRLGIDVERAVISALRALVRKRRLAWLWESENSAEIEAFNRYVDAYGTVGEEFRSEA